MKSFSFIFDVKDTYTLLSSYLACGIKEDCLYRMVGCYIEAYILDKEPLLYLYENFDDDLNAVSLIEDFLLDMETLIPLFKIKQELNLFREEYGRLQDKMLTVYVEGQNLGHDSLWLSMTGIK